MVIRQNRGSYMQLIGKTMSKFPGRLTFTLIPYAHRNLSNRVTQGPLLVQF